MVWNINDPQGNESAKIRHMIVPYTRGMGLDLGCGPWKAWPHFIGVDNYDEWQEAEPWKPDVAGDVTNLEWFKDRSLDFVYSSHTLEHLDDPAKVLREWWRVLKWDGYLVLYLPHADYYPNIGEEGANPDHKSDFRPQDIIDMLPPNHDIVRLQERNSGQEYSFLLVAKKIKGTKRLQSYKERNPEGKPVCFIVRYGGFGDLIQMSSILPWLKTMGYYVVVNTTPKGKSVVEHDPHIDEFFLQDKDQVPNQELGAYWSALEKECEKFINLSESVEGLLLTMPGRTNHALPQPARHLVCDVNYMEMTHAIANVPPPFHPAFYPSAAETRWADAYRKMIGENNQLVMWALSGSSVHKAWPWAEAAVAWLLDNHPKIKIMFVGDALCQMLELGICWQTARYLGITDKGAEECKLSELLVMLRDHFGEDRIICRSGSLNIRETLTMAQRANCVVGPETGVLNAVAHDENVGKVVMLSHSTQENLTKYWRQVMSIWPDAKEVPCYPCHRLHYDWTHCYRDEMSGAARCAASISPEEVTRAILRVLGYRVEKKEAAD